MIIANKCAKNRKVYSGHLHHVFINPRPEGWLLLSGEQTAINPMRTSLLFFALLCLTSATEAASFPRTLWSNEPIFSSASDNPLGIICPNDTVLLTPPFNCIAQFTYNVLVTDDQPGWTLSQTAGLPSGGAFPPGVTVNQFLATGSGGNTATCSFSVTVKDDVPPVAACSDFSVTLTYDYPGDCYEGKVGWLRAKAFDNGSYDNCSVNFKFTVRRQMPYSDCINSLNPVNGHPDCEDSFPDFPSEFEQAISEGDSLKLYCCEVGTTQEVILRVYQLNLDGSFMLGSNGLPVFGECTAHVEVKECKAGIVGKTALDTDLDCLPDAVQIGISGLIVKATDSNGDEHYAGTNQFGNYRVPVLPAGSVDVELFSPLPLWEICNPDTTVTLASTYSEVRLDFAVNPVADCPLLSLDLSTTILRPCDTSDWVVKYCNLGEQPAEDAYVQFFANGPMNFAGASLPFLLIGDTVTVQVGDIAAGQCGSFHAFYEPPCDNNIVGERICLYAHIFPDTLCLPVSPLWSGAQIAADATCNGDSALFTLRNAGLSPTSEPLDYVIIDDMVIMREGQIPAGFNPGATMHEAVYTEGSSVRIISEQEAGHPLAEPPSLAVENCNGITSPSLMLEFRNETGNFFTGIECREIVAAFDPNEKLSFPRGYANEHFIEPNTRLDYQLNFQNTGNAPALQIVLRDTLSPLLEPATLRMGVSSHPYTWEIDGPGILTVRFNNIMLPDSSTDEAGSHGFVHFNIAQKPDNPNGSVIQNRAGIYFDINPVVLTNTVFHTVGLELPVLTSGSEPGVGNTIMVYPNPASGSLFIPFAGDAQVNMFDLLGRMVLTSAGKSPGLLVHRNNLAGGVYLLEVRTASGKVYTGKVVWQNDK